MRYLYSFFITLLNIEKKFVTYFYAHFFTSSIVLCSKKFAYVNRCNKGNSCKQVDRESDYKKGRNVSISTCMDGLHYDQVQILTDYYTVFFLSKYIHLSKKMCRLKTHKVMFNVNKKKYLKNYTYIFMNYDCIKSHSFIHFF